MNKICDNFFPKYKIIHKTIHPIQTIIKTFLVIFVQGPSVYPQILSNVRFGTKYDKHF